MASGDTWEEFLAKLDNSPMGKRHGGFVHAMQEIEKSATESKMEETNEDQR